MSFTKINSERVISYINGVLNYYWAIKAKELLKLINEHLQLSLKRQNLDNIISEALIKDINSLLFKRHRDIIYNSEVEDLKTLLNEQKSRDELSNRLVSEKEAGKAISFEFWVNNYLELEDTVIHYESCTLKDNFM